MPKNKNLQPNSEVNFILKGVNSIQIGIYFLLFAYLTKQILSGFISDSSMLGMMSIEIVEVMLISLGIFFVIFSYFALFFSSRRTCRKSFYSRALEVTSLHWVLLLFLHSNQGVFLRSRAPHSLWCE